MRSLLLSTLVSGGLGKLVNVYEDKPKDIARVSSCVNERGEMRLVANIQKKGVIPAGWDDSEDGTEWTRSFSPAILDKHYDHDSNIVHYSTILTRQETSYKFNCEFSLDKQLVSSISPRAGKGRGKGKQRSDPVTEGPVHEFPYQLNMDFEKTQLGERVSFSIGPVNEGLVYMRILRCDVTNGDETYTVFGRNGAMCFDSTVDFWFDGIKSIQKLKGFKDKQTFSYKAFKWISTSGTGDETQQLSCTIEQSFEPFRPYNLKACIDHMPPVEAICNSKCRKMQKKLDNLRKKIANGRK